MLLIEGNYGKTTERLIMLEIMNNGPVVLNFEPTEEFSYYKSGIFHSMPAAQVNFIF